MLRATSLLTLVALSGCFTVTGLSLGIVSGYAHDSEVRARMPKPVAPAPAPDDATCIARRRVAVHAVSIAHSIDERKRWLATIPNCLPPPPPEPESSIGTHALIGLLIGVALDAALVGAFIWDCNHSPNPGECL